jgi:hypothetical protein
MKEASMAKQDSKLTTKAAIEKVLAGKRKMTVAQIADAAIPLTALKGKTPQADVLLRALRRGEEAGRTGREGRRRRRVQAQPEAPQGHGEVVTPRFNIVLSGSLDGDTVMTTDDTFEAATVEDAERQAIDAWSAAEPRFTFRPLLVMQLPTDEDAVA